MATAFEIRALLEDTPEFPAQLAASLEMELSSVTLLLEHMQIPACTRCGRRFVPNASGKTRYCSTACDENEPTEGRASQPEATATKRPNGSAPRPDEREFEVVWNGVGPLPGAGGAAGLGSTLSGIHFSIGRRL